MIFHTSFKLLREAGVNKLRYRRLADALGGAKAYGRDRPITILQILDANGLDEALWALRAVPPEQAAARDKFSRLLACDFSERTEGVWQRSHPGNTWMQDVRAVARRYAWGQATGAELARAEAEARAAWAAAVGGLEAEATRSAMWAATWAPRATMWAASGVAGAVWEAARAAEAARASLAARAAERAWQEQHLRKKLNEKER